MGQKCHPIGFRLGYIRDHDTTWFADRNYQEYVIEDMKIRDYLDRFDRKKPPTVARDMEERRVEESLKNASISRLVIGRGPNIVNLTIHSAKPGIIIGRAGRGIEVLRILLQRLTRRQVQIEVVEERDPDLDATLVAEKIASQLSRRISFRRAVRQAVQATERIGAPGIKVMVSGRLAGGEMARTHVHRAGSIPLQTLRADIDFGFREAATTYGNIGVKVWIYRGEKLPENEQGELPSQLVLTPEPLEEAKPAAAEERPKARRRGRRRRSASSDEKGAEQAAEPTGEVEAVVEEAAPAMAPPPAEPEAVVEPAADAAPESAPSAAAEEAPAEAPSAAEPPADSDDQSGE